jgi:hypothetical protein
MTREEEELAIAMSRSTSKEIFGGRLEMDKNLYKAKYLLSLVQDYVPDLMTYNGYVDSRAVLVYFKDGEEISRFEGGARTYTPKFKELCHKLVDEMLEGKIK